MIYYTGFGIENRQTAGAKAPSDILHFCKQRHYQFIGVKRPPKKLPRPLQLVWKYCFSMKYWNNVLHTLEKAILSSISIHYTSAGHCRSLSIS